jgi:hypothetical protein
MARYRRILTTQRGEAGRVVERASSKRVDSVALVAVLSLKEAEELDEDLRSIDEAQQDALASGGRHYLGARP